MILLANIQEYVSNLRIIDIHEHVTPYALRKENQTNLFGLLHYLESDLITAGMPRGAIQPSGGDVEKNARIFKKYFERTKNTAYARAFKIAMTDLYGTRDWTERGILELNEQVISASNDPTWYDTVLNKKSGIDLVLNLDQQ